MNRSQEIVQLIIDRDQKGLEILYDNYAHALLGISYRILNNTDLAEETLNKALLKIWDNISKYDSNKGAFFTWMSTITRNLSLDQRRSKHFIQDSKTDEIDKSIFQIQASNINTSKLDTDTLLTGLDDKYRMVLEFLYLKGYTQQELSDEAGIPLGTIKTRLKKAIDILRKNLGPESRIFSFLIPILYFITSNQWL